MSEGHVHLDPSNKRIALLISVLALALALAETAAKGCQTDTLRLNVEASNTWAFFQAKTIRQTVLRTAVEEAALALTPADQVNAAARAERVAKWQADVSRWESEPSTGEGRKELSAKAREIEGRRDLAMTRYHGFEVSSASLQVAIVLASAAVVTGVVALAWAAGGLGVVATAFAALAWVAPGILPFH